MARDSFRNLCARARRVGVAAAVLLLTSCGVLLTPHHRLERAQREMHAGQWQDAAVDLRVVVQKEPKNAQAWLLLAQVSLDAADLTGARSALRSAKAAGAKGPKADALRARIWLEEGEGQALLDALAQRRITLQEPDRTLDTARALLAVHRPDEALTQLQPLLAAQPTLTEARDLKAEALAAQAKLGTALRELDAVLRQDAKSPEPALLKGLILQQQGRYTAAEEALQTALKRMPPAEPILHRVRALIALTEVRLALGNLTAAAKSEALTAKLEPRSPATALLDARLKIAHRNLEGGVAELEQLLVGAPGFTEARLLLGATLLERGDLQQAQQQLQQVVQSTPDNLAARKLLAEVQLKLGEPQGALGVLSPALATDALDPQLLSLYGAAASRIGDKQALIEALKRSEQQHPDDPTVRRNLATAYLAAGEPQQALAVIERTPDDGNLQRDRLLIASLAGAKGSQAASAALARLLAAHPRDPGVLDLAASYDLTQGRLQDARAALRTSVSIAPDEVSTQVALARLDAAEGDPAAAQKRLRAALEAHPGSLPVRIALAQMLTAQKSYGQARTLLEQAAAHPDPQVQFALAQVALAGGDLKSANAALDQAIAQRPGDAGLIEDAGLLLMQGNQFDAALARFAQATQLAPKDAGDWLNTARAQLALNQPVAARASLEKANALQPHWLPVMTALVYSDVRQGDGPRALARLRALEAAQPGDAGILQLAGDVKMALHQPAAAAEDYARAQALRPSAWLAASLYRARLLAHAPQPQRVLEEWLAREPQSAPVRDLLGQYYLGTGKLREAAQAFQAAIAQNPNDVLALNNLAWALNELGDPKAIALAQRAHRLAPNLSSVDDTLGWVLVHNGQAAGAVAYLKSAVKLDPSDLDAKYHLAYALAKSGDPSAARRILDTLLSDPKPFGSRSEAQQLLTSVKS